ncbi:CCA tRNA nucleotidyltransferase [Oxyplasma meridianum]|uniref:CCA-adding enzyme n=1 Tax=Oxyplasma meridianum TaxID=3073602 RepID=A0AAX4NIJ3_9ARCH
MKDINDLLSLFRPDSAEEESIRKTVDFVFEKIVYYCRENNIDAEPVLVGSVAKGTNLRDGDIDIFVRFEKKYPRAKMEKLGLSIGHFVLENGKEKYAEHPYVTGFIDGKKVDIVPSYRMLPGENILSSVDRTPLHTEYVKSKLSLEGKDEVRKLKLFMKHIGVYGSDARTLGFSGYICELLIINTGNFIKTIEMFATMRGKLIIGDPQYTEVFQSPAIVIDPTDSTRNAAAAISLENLSRMKFCSRLYLNGKLPEYNQSRGGRKKDKKERGTTLRVFRVKKPDILDDILYPQALRFKNAIWGIMERNDLRPISWEICMQDHIDVIIESENKVVPALKTHRGPPVDEPSSIDFYNKWMNMEISRGPYILGDRIYVDLLRQQKSISDVVREGLKKINIGKNIDDQKETMEIFDPYDPGRDSCALDLFYSKFIFQVHPPEKTSRNTRSS